MVERFTSDESELDREQWDASLVLFLQEGSGTWWESHRRIQD